MSHDRRGRHSFCVGPYTLGTASEKGGREARMEGGREGQSRGEKMGEIRR